MCACVCMPSHDMNMKFRIGSCLPPCVNPRDLNSGNQAWQQTTTPDESSPLPVVSTFQFYYYLLDELKDMVYLFSDIKKSLISF